MELDTVDREILRILQADARTPFSEVARRIDMSSATVHERVDRLQEAGVLEGYHASVDADALGFEMDAFVGVRIEHNSDGDVVSKLEDIDPIREIYSIAGKLDMILRVRAADSDDLREVVFDQLGEIESFHRTNTMVILGSEYESEELPI